AGMRRSASKFRCRAGTRGCRLTRRWSLTKTARTCFTMAMTMAARASATRCLRVGEAWASVMQETVKTFGVKEFSHARSEVELHIEEIRLAGYTVLADVLSPEEVEEAREKIDRIYQMQLEEIGGNQELEAINDT